MTGHHHLNLNAKRAERAAARGEPLMVSLGDQQFELVPEMPLDAATLAGSGDFQAAMSCVIQPQDWERFKAAGPTMDDILEIIKFYGTSLGEASASIISSLNTGEPSRQTSAGSTG